MQSGQTPAKTLTASLNEVPKSSVLTENNNDVQQTLPLTRPIQTVQTLQQGILLIELLHMINYI